LNWLTPKSTCEWEGVTCDNDLNVVSILMERNRLSGVIPNELALISGSIRSLDLTSNRIYMIGDDFNLFESLVNLENLHMNDNFLVYDEGLPSQFGKMTNLKSIKLSYNILVGQLEGTSYPILSGLNQLTHLELESNAFNGTFPEAISDMGQIVYIYMRQNVMNYNLDFIKGGKISNLCELLLLIFFLMFFVIIGHHNKYNTT
jgi:hypothetical protein